MLFNFENFVPLHSLRIPRPLKLSVELLTFNRMKTSDRPTGCGICLYYKSFVLKSLSGILYGLHGSNKVIKTCKMTQIFFCETIILEFFKTISYNDIICYKNINIYHTLHTALYRFLCKNVHALLHIV